MFTGLKGKKRPGHRRHVGHRPGHRRAFRCRGRARRHQLSHASRRRGRDGRARPPGAGAVHPRRDRARRQPRAGARRRVQGGRGRRHGGRRSSTSWAGWTSWSTTPASRSPPTRTRLSVEHFDRVLAVNLRGAFMAAQAAIRHFLDEDKPGVDHQRLQRPSDHPQAALSRLFRQQGRHAEPDPHAGPGVRRPRHPRQRHRAGRDDHAHQPGLGR